MTSVALRKKGGAVTQQKRLPKPNDLTALVRVTAHHKSSLGGYIRMPAQLWKSHSGRAFCFLIQISVHQAQYDAKSCRETFQVYPLGTGVGTGTFYGANGIGQNIARERNVGIGGIGTKIQFALIILPDAGGVF